MLVNLGECFAFLPSISTILIVLLGASATFERSKPDAFNLSNMVEAQVSFQVVRVGRHDYVFVPKLRA